MKIGILGTRGIPNNYGGFEQFAQFLAPELVKRGHDVFVYNSHSHPYQQSAWSGVNIIHCKDPEHKLGTFGQFLYDLNCIKDARKRNYDVLLHLGYSSDSIWWRRWPKNTVNIVNMDGLEWKRSKYNWVTRAFLKKAEALAAKHAHTIIADSMAMREYLLTRYQKSPLYIPYAAAVFTNPDPSDLKRYNLKPFEYNLLIARMEKENNIEMIIKGYINSDQKYPLFIIGGIHNKTGKRLAQSYQNTNLVFADAIYDSQVLNNLRFHSRLYFHGHSVGGTNPSLLEAMACGSRIAAHNNVFNKAVLGEDADYFSNESEISHIIQAEQNSMLTDQRRIANLEKIRSDYTEQKIVGAYESVMLNALPC